MKARVDRDICIGSAVCVSIAPGVFELGNDGLSRVVDQNAADDLYLEAAQNCPVQAIFVEDDQGNQVYP